jgi:hypothetical protein
MADNLYIRHEELVGISVMGETGAMVKPAGSVWQ